MGLLEVSERRAKPFLKWAGGKGQLIRDIAQRLPEGLRDGTIKEYVEPFVGGGAVFFFVAQNFPSLQRCVLLDANPDLINCYLAVRNSPDGLIAELDALKEDFLARKGTKRKEFYVSIRAQFNREKTHEWTAATAAKLIFLNRTCFNGLYRVNKKGMFNVPFGDYANPRICDAENLRRVSALLKKAKIHCADFEAAAKYIDRRGFVYLDPPYRPISRTSSFTSYAKSSFSDADQQRLALFCRRIDKRGARFLLSNSDPKNENPDDDFFEDNYSGFTIDRVKAVRAINCQGSGRGPISELLIWNY
jgi:DNA adenine methylase